MTLRRLLIFVLLGPSLGMLTGLFGLLPAMSIFAGEPMHFTMDQVVGLSALSPVAYVVGFVPALVAGVFEGVLAIIAFC